MFTFEVNQYNAASYAKMFISTPYIYVMYNVKRTKVFTSQTIILFNWGTLIFIHTFFMIRFIVFYMLKSITAILILLHNTFG